MQNEGHVALYRKYRPSAFKDVRNQDHIVSVLEGAIEKNAIPHALLFTGSRGTGKTTVARIFAREIGADEIDIYEVDAASTRGIDSIRELQEAAYTLPYKSAYKVYIIDEVHMLTKEAFNAFLKTLEEPPAHVIFILATTEADKLLDTITSRCQVFQFRAPSREVLRTAALDVAKKEKFKLTADGADIIAIAADGSFRDMLGVVQKVIMASKDATADADEVARIVGAPKSALLGELMSALGEKNATNALASVKDAVMANVDMKLFTELLLERLRSVILYRLTKDGTVLAAYSERDREAMEKEALLTNSAINSKLLERFLKAGESLGKTYLPQLPLELAIVDVCSTP